MGINNRINSPTNSSGWKSFTTNITGSVANPTPNTVTTLSYYLQYGNMLYINYYYVCASGGGAGSGIYQFSIPSGFTIDTTIMPTLVGSNFRSPLGFGTIAQGSVRGLAFSYLYNNTTYAIVPNASGTTSFVTMSASWYGLSSAATVSANLSIPIL